MSRSPFTYRNYLLGVLLLVYAFNAVDGLALSLMLQDIKTDLHLNDVQLGLLTGIAFAIFYSIMGLPIARWADHGNRVSIISITTALWCALVALCGVATNFPQLILIRMGVGVGEAGCIPPAHSLIADYFDRAERPRALGLYMMGAPVSVVIGYFFAGWLNEFYGWRMTFVVLGLPGLLLAGLVRLTLKEPRIASKASAESASSSPGSVGAAAIPSDEVPAAIQPSLRSVCTALWSSRSFRHLLLAFSVASFFGNGIAQWQPAFFTRSFGLNTGELGTWFTLIYGMGGLIGIYTGGQLASRLAPSNERLQLRALAFLYIFFGLVSGGVYLSSNRYLAFALMGIAFTGGAATAGPLFATIQTLVPERMRATSIALIYLFSNLIGTGLGPLAVGSLSDALAPLKGDESLRFALLALCPGYAWVSWHLWRASASIAKDIASATPRHEDDSNLGIEANA